jgi:hypothetical protein
MKKNILFVLLQCILLFVFFNAFSQTTYYEYKYDAAGNRIRRHVIVIINKVANQNDSVAKDTIAAMAETEENKLLFTENIGEVNIRVFPNPTIGKLNIAIEGDIVPNNAFIEIYNEAGIKIENLIITTKNFTIDLSKHSTGIYYLKLSLNGKNETFKVVKTN